MRELVYDPYLCNDLATGHGVRVNFPAINVSFLIVPYSKFKPTKHAYHWKKGLAQWIILIMIAENAAMDDDNEAGMALCDCLSEYQDDTGEWWHREQRSQRYLVTLRLNIPIKVVPAPGPGPTWHRLNTKPENLASVPGTRAGGWSRLFKISEFICFWWGWVQARCPVSIVIWTNIETKSKFISGKYVYLCIIPTVNMSLPLPLFYACNDFQSNELIWRITSHTIIDKCKKYWCICWQIFKYLDYFYSSPIISKFCGSVYDKQ